MPGGRAGAASAIRRRLAVATRLAVALVSLAMVAPAQTGDPAGSEPAAEFAFVELSTADDSHYVGGAIDVVARVGIRAEVADDGLVQMFRQPLDLPIRLTADWLETLPDARRLGPPPDFATAATRTAVVQHRPARFARVDDVERNGVRFVVHEWRERLVAERPTELQLIGTRLAFRYATAFDVDFFGDRVPRDAQDVEFTAAPLPIRISAPPERDRPPDFSGAVGRFTLTARRIEDRALTVGEPFRVVLEIEGSGMLDGFDAPRLAADAGLHRVGSIEEREPGLRRITFDLVARRAGVTAVPAFALAYLDPGPPPVYRRVTSAPIPIEVRPAADGPDATDGASPAGDEPRTAEPEALTEPSMPDPIPGVDTLFGIRPVPELPSDAPRPTIGGRESGPSRVAAIAALLAPWVIAALALWSQRFAASRPARRALARQRRAARNFHRSIAGGTHPERAFREFLATRLAIAPSEVVDPQLADRLVSAGAAPDLAMRAVSTLDALAAPRYGGAPLDRTAAGLADVVGALDVALASSPPRSSARGGSAAVALLALALSGTSTAQQVPDLAAAEQAFARGDAAAASAIWLAALEAGRHAPAPLCHDLGNAAHALGRPAEAVLWYRRALAFAPGDLQAAANLRLVERQLGLGARGPAPLGVTWLDSLRSRIGAAPPSATLALAALLQTLGLLALLARKRRGPALAAVIGGVALAIGPIRDAFAPTGELAIVVRADARLTLEPHRDAATRSVLPVGAAVRVLEASDRWARVVREGDSGWTEQRNLQPVAWPPPGRPATH